MNRHRKPDLAARSGVPRRTIDIEHNGLRVKSGGAGGYVYLTTPAGGAIVLNRDTATWLQATALPAALGGPLADPAAAAPATLPVEPEPDDEEPAPAYQELC